METLPPANFYGYTVFCDDIRQEAGGKVTFVGVYTDHMVVHGTFPCLLPKFAMWIQYNQRRDKVVTPVKFAIFLPGDTDEPSIITEIPDEGALQGMKNAQDMAKAYPQQEENSPAFVGLGHRTIFSPFVIAEPGLILVRAIREDRFLRLGGIRVLAGTVPT